MFGDHTRQKLCQNKIFADPLAEILEYYDMKNICVSVVIILSG